MLPEHLITSNTLLIVRPTHRQAEDLATCQAANWQGVAFSPLAIVPQPNQATLLSHALDQSDALFWVSPTAVDIAQQLSGSLHTCSQPHIAVGKATYRALQKASANNIWVSEQGNDSEAVLTLPIWQTLPKNALIYIIAGEQGRPFLRQKLLARGFNVQLCEIYQRQEIPLDWSIFQAAQACAAWVTSSQLAQLLFTQSPTSLTQQLQSLLYFTHHERIRATLLACGAQNVFLVQDLQQALDLLNNPFVLRFNGE